MATTKFIILSALLAYVNGGGIVPAVEPVVAKVVEPEHDPNPQYTFGYDVQDSITGDSKSQVETRSGDVVRGQYTVDDPDGTRRIVDYTADPVNGFNAVVRKTPIVKALAAPIAPAVVAAEPAVAPVVAKVANPVVAKVGAPAVVPSAYTTAVATPLAPRAAPPLGYQNPFPYANIPAPLAYNALNARFGYSPVPSPFGFNPYLAPAFPYPNPAQFYNNFVNPLAYNAQLYRPFY